ESDFLYSGESTLNFKLFAVMDPEQIGFAGSIFDIRGGHEFATAGVIARRENLLGELTDDGNLQGNNDILDIQAFQLPPLFNGNFISDNPILIYEFDWEVTDFFTIISVATANHLSSDVYVTSSGQSVEYDSMPTTARVFVPASATGLLGLTGMAFAARRRRTS
ncbi:MAG: hypothetical protein ACF8LK_03225, partial [Phycisphaerales bacterium JB041]